MAKPQILLLELTGKIVTNSNYALNKCDHLVIHILKACSTQSSALDLSWRMIEHPYFFIWYKPTLKLIKTQQHTNSQANLYQKMQKICDSHLKQGP